MSKPSDRVGGRHSNPTTPAGGGGYLDICKKSRSGPEKKFQEKIEISIDDLKKMGLSGKWLEIAERVGPEMWLQIWEILDRENIDQPVNSRDCQRLRVPAYSKFKKFQRNKFIEQLIMQGYNTRQIHQALGKIKIEPISLQMVRQIKQNLKKSA